MNKENPIIADIAAQEVGIERIPVRTTAPTEGSFAMKNGGAGHKITGLVAPTRAQPLLNVEYENVFVKIDDLRDFDRNPRTATDASVRKLKRSLKETGYHSLIKATKDNRIMGGHLRKRVLRDLGFTEIEVRRAKSDLTDEQFRQIVIQDNLHAGKWDHDILGNEYDPDDLLEWGMGASLQLGDDEPLKEDAEPTEKPAPTGVCKACGQSLPIAE